MRNAFIVIHISSFTGGSRLRTSPSAIIISCSLLVSLPPFVISPHILQPLHTAAGSLVRHPSTPHFTHTPFLCAGKGAARQTLYSSGNSDSGRPAHWHRFSWSTILLRQTDKKFEKDNYLQRTRQSGRTERERVCQTPGRQRGGGEQMDKTSSSITKTDTLYSFILTDARLSRPIIHCNVICTQFSRLCAKVWNPLKRASNQCSQIPPWCIDLKFIWAYRVNYNSPHHGGVHSWPAGHCSKLF